MKFIELTDAGDGRAILYNIAKITMVRPNHGGNSGSIVSTAEFGMDYVAECYIEIRALIVAASQ